MLFEEIGLIPEILQAVKEAGFEHPTPIQEKTIPYLLKEENDLIAFAQTGTGKTAAFGLPVIQKVDPGFSAPQALILSPTRELCLQITQDLQNFSKHIRGLRVVPVYGGASIEKQIGQLSRNAQIVVGTPGRVYDLIKRKKFSTSAIKWLVLDEADEMLSMGFKEELDNILQTVPSDRRSLLFSATMPEEVRRIANLYMRAPAEISAGTRNTGAENVQHHCFILPNKDGRFQALIRYVDIHPDIFGIIFCRTRAETQEVADLLIKNKYNAEALHGDLSQAQRDLVMNRFRTRHLQLLVATDVAARGLDVNDLTHVINYSLPDDHEVYIHRSGRTGRAGKSGISLSLVRPVDRSRLREFERRLNKKFEEKKIPTGFDVCQKQLFSLIDKVEKVEVNEDQIAPFVEAIYEKLEWLSREELIKHFVSVQFNHFLSYYKDSADLNIASNDRSDRKRGDRDRERSDRDGRYDRDRGDRGGDRGRRPERRRDDREFDREFSFGDRGKSKEKKAKPVYSTCYINIGKKDKITPGDIISLINKSLPGKQVDIGKIEIMKKVSSIEVDKHVESDVLRALSKAKFKGVNLEANLVNEDY